MPSDKELHKQNSMLFVVSIVAIVGIAGMFMAMMKPSAAPQQTLSSNLGMSDADATNMVGMGSSCFDCCSIEGQKTWVGDAGKVTNTVIRCDGGGWHSCSYWHYSGKSSCVHIGTEKLV